MPTSDVDCVLLVDGARLTPDGAWRQIARAWRYAPPRGWAGVEVVSFARVPILRATHERSRVQLDVCVGHEMGVLNTATGSMRGGLYFNAALLAAGAIALLGTLRVRASARVNAG